MGPIADSSSHLLSERSRIGVGRSGLSGVVLLGRHMRARMLRLAELRNASSTLVVVPIIVVVQAIELNLSAAATCVYELVVAHVDSHMMNASSLAGAEEQQISRLQIA